jgi:gliding motility-associated-like protein
VDTQPEVQIPDNVILCEGSTITLTSNLSGTWSNGTVGTSTVVSEPGIYSIQVVNGECTDIDGSTVTLMLPPTVDLGPDVTICDDQFASFDATFSENTTSYSWSNQATASMILVNEPGIYEVTLENACGTASDEVALETTICGWNIFVPSAFTPNGDEINDAWSVKGYNVSNLKVTVYNRFGDMIWETEAFEDEWRPDPLQIGDDAYNYRIEGITYLGENIVQHGYVRLLK